MIDAVLGGADDVLPEGVEKLPNSFLAKPRGDEVERGVTEVVVGPAARHFELGHARDLVIKSRITHRHQVMRIPVAAQVVGQTLIHPKGNSARDDASRDQVELEDVSEFVSDQALQSVGSAIHGDDHAIADGL